MEWNLNTDRCTGCCACADVCPVGAISMEVDSSGNRRPHLNSSLCISCSKCKKVCPQAESFLKRGGVVYGAAIILYNQRVECRHLRITDSKDLHLIQGSKYVQSKMDGVYKMIKEDIKVGKDVLFSGTSCQVAAIKNIYIRLILCVMECLKT